MFVEKKAYRPTYSLNST